MTIALKYKDDTILKNIFIVTMLIDSNPSKQIHVQRRWSGVNDVVLVPFIVKIEYISHLFLMFLLLTLN